MPFSFYEWNRSPKAKFIFNRKEAKRRNIPWELTFEEWWKIWQDSGHWEERGYGKGKYSLCRFRDEGPYSTSNVYIDLATNNCRDAWYNGKSQHLPPPKLTKEQRQEIYYLTRNYYRGLAQILAERYGVTRSYISVIKNDSKYSCSS